MTLVIAVCALVGALAGIAGSMAAPSSKSSKATQAKKQALTARERALIHRAEKLKRALRGGAVVHARGFGLAMGVPFGGPFGGPFMGGPVHAEAVVPKPDGSGFMTVTTDSGTVNNVDGTTVHLKEGTDKQTYKDDVGVDVGSDARVIRDGAKATLGDLKAGDHVHVVTGLPKGNIVIAADDAWIAQQKAQMKKEMPRRFFKHRFFAPGGPPPGAPAPGTAPAPGSYPGSPWAPGSNS